jgi:two-component system, chemotaxis family, chemotaxis protein CheY
LTRLQLTLPPIDEPTGASSIQRERREEQGLQTRRILVVDDDEVILAAVAGILVQEGFNVDTATNGSEALDCVERTHPDCVLLDMRMPILDGWAFARILRERDIDLRIVVMTAAHDARTWAEEIGAKAYLAKPFDLDDLIAIVERCCTAP